MTWAMIGVMASRTSASSRQSTAREAWQRLRAVGSDPEVVAAEHKLMHETGLSGGPLRALRQLPLDDSLSMRQLAARLGCDNSYVTSLVDALERLGLAAREPHPTDRRIKVIALTARGREVAARVQEEYATAPSSFDSLSSKELETLCELLRRLDRTAA
jgi:DNA-binding MarR family transcriptional regulator